MVMTGAVGWHALAYLDLEHGIPYSMRYLSSKIQESSDEGVISMQTLGNDKTISSWHASTSDRLVPDVTSQYNGQLDTHEPITAHESFILLHFLKLERKMLVLIAMSCTRLSAAGGRCTCMAARGSSSCMMLYTVL